MFNKSLNDQAPAEINSMVISYLEWNNVAVVGRVSKYMQFIVDHTILHHINKLVENYCLTVNKYPEKHQLFSKKSILREKARDFLMHLEQKQPNSIACLVYLEEVKNNCEDKFFARAVVKPLVLMFKQLINTEFELKSLSGKTNTLLYFLEIIDKDLLPKDEHIVLAKALIKTIDPNHLNKAISDKLAELLQKKDNHISLWSEIAAVI